MLLEERANRFRPASDNLVVAAWNGWTISSLVSGALIFNEPGWLELAVRAADHLASVHVVNGALRRSSRDGEADAAEGGADDYGAVIEAFTLLAGATGDSTWLQRAVGLADRAVEVFRHPDGGFYDAVETGLFQRPRSVTDNVTPGGTSALIAGLRTAGLLAERADLVARADEAAKTTWVSVAETPRFTGSALADLMISDEARRGLKPAVAVVVSGDPLGELSRAAWRLAPAGSVILTAPTDAVGFGTHLEGRADGLAYVCRGTVCFDPVSDYAELKSPLWSRV